MSTAPDYYNYRQLTWSCPQCSWEGLGRECNTAEEFRNWHSFSISCPRCSRELAHFRVPTGEELRQNWDRLDDSHRGFVEAYGWAEADRKQRWLQTAAQLPDLPGEKLVITWDALYLHGRGVADDKQLRCGDQVVWQERCSWENWERFLEIADLLRERYGDRLYDLVPTTASLDSLYGDRYSAPLRVEEKREELREAWERAAERKKHPH